MFHTAPLHNAVMPTLGSGASSALVKSSLGTLWKLGHSSYRTTPLLRKTQDSQVGRGTPVPQTSLALSKCTSLSKSVSALHNFSPYAYLPLCLPQYPFPSPRLPFPPAMTIYSPSREDTLKSCASFLYSPLCQHFKACLKFYLLRKSSQISPLG